MDNAKIRNELIIYGRKVVSSGLVTGTGGNISARCGDIVYLSASGIALDEMAEEDYIGVDVNSGKVVDGSKKPTSETALHLACYRKRKDIQAIVHTHSPWAGGVMSSGVMLKPMFPEFICDINRITHIDYVAPTTQKLADAVEKVAGENEVILMSNHGTLAFGRNLKEAYYRNLIVEDAAKSLIAASIVGKPRFLTDEEVEELRNLDSIKYRRGVSGS